MQLKRRTKSAGEESSERIAELKLQGVKSDNKLLAELEDAQKRLDRLGFYNKSYDEIVDDIVRSHYRERHVERLMDRNPRKPFPVFMFMMMSLALIVLGGGSYLLLTNPTITGAAVQNIVTLASSRIVSTSFGVFVVILIAGMIFHKIEHRQQHKYDEYKPPEPPQ